MLPKQILQLVIDYCRLLQIWEVDENYLNWGPTILLGVACAPLDHCFILKIFLKSF